MAFKQSIFVLLVALGCVFLQATIFGTFGPRWFIPNLCLSIIIFLGVFEANPLGAFLAFLVGLFLDLASAPLVGPWSGSFAALFGFLAQGGRKLFIDSVLTIIVLSFFGALGTQLVYLFLFSQFSFDWDQLLSWTFIGSAISSAVFAPFIFRMLIRFYPRRLVGSGRFSSQRLF